VPAYRDLVGRLLDRLIPDPLVQTQGLPTTAELSLLRQPHEERIVLHLIHATPQRRGLAIDVVEERLPLRDVRIGIRLDRPAVQVNLAPGGGRLKAEVVDGVTWVTVPRVDGHQVVAFTQSGARDALT
jgi:hypothetical protein